MGQTLKIRKMTKKNGKAKGTAKRKRKKGWLPLYKFDFSSAEYKHFLEVCPFTDDELKIIDMRRRGKSNTHICQKLNIAERTLSKYIKSIANKIAKEL